MEKLKKTKMKNYYIIILFFLFGSCFYNSPKTIVKDSYYIKQTALSNNDTGISKDSALIKGIVRDRLLSENVENALVSIKKPSKSFYIDKKEVLTDSKGRFEITVPIGEYIIVIRHKKNKELTTKPIQIKSSIYYEIELYLGYNDPAQR